MEKTLRLILTCIFIVSIISTASSSEYVTLTALVERIAQLEERDRIQQNEINHLEERDQLQVKRIAHLEERDRLQKDDIGRLMDHVQNQHDEIKDIRQQLIPKRDTPQNPSMPTRNKESQKKRRHFPIVDKLVREANDIPFNHSQRESVQTSRIRRSENEMDVAFFATLKSYQLHAGVNQTVLFDNVVTNIGNAYHSHLGSFIAPVSGTYVFSVTILTWAKSNAYIISKDGIAVSQIYCDASKSGYESTSQTVILTLNQNDDITIKSQHADGQTHGEHFSSFAGFLLNQAYSNAIIG